MCTGPSLNPTRRPDQRPAEDEPSRFRQMIETLFKRYRQLILELTRHLSEHISVPNDILEDFSQSTQGSVIRHYFPLTPEISKDSVDGFVHAHRAPSRTSDFQSFDSKSAQNHRDGWLIYRWLKEGLCLVSVSSQFVSCSSDPELINLH